MGFINSKALDFDATDDYVIVSAHSSIDNLFATSSILSFWIYPRSDGEGSSGRVLDKRGGSSAGWMVYLTHESAGFVRLNFWVDFSTTDGRWRTSLRPIPINAWSYCEVEYLHTSATEDPTFRINDVAYTVGDGLAEVSTPSGSYVGDASVDLNVGGIAGAATFDGLIDEVSFWNTTSVDGLYNGGTPTDLWNHTKSANLQLWLRMGDGDTYPTIKDYSQNSNDGTMTNMAAGDIVASTLGPLLQTSWQFLIDWNNDNDYNDAYEDITGDVMSAQWRLGFNEPYQHVAAEPRGQFILRNDDKKYSPENTSSPLSGDILPFRRVKIQNLESGTVAMYQGYIKNIRPSPGLYGELTTSIEFGGIQQFLGEQEFYSPFYEDVTTDTVLVDILSETAMPATFGNNLFIDRTGQNLIDTHYIAGDSDFINAETGKTTFAYVGDTWEDGISARQAINSLVQSDRGWFFEDRSGSATYWNRHHMLTNDTIQGTVDNSWFELDYRYSEEDIKNIIRVSNYPRDISATSDIVLWSLDETKRIQVGETVTFRARYAEQDSEAKIAARNVTVPNEEDGSFVITPTTGQYRIVAEEDNARSMQLKVENLGNIKFDITTMQVKGQKVTTYNKEEYESIDVTSVGLYGRHVMKLDNQLLNSDAFAQAVADYELARRKDPRGVVRSVRMNQRNSTTRAQAINRTIGDWIEVVDDQSVHTGNYIIMGESHQWQAGDVHKVEWVLEPADGLDYIIIDKSGKNEIDSGRYIAA